MVEMDQNDLVVANTSRSSEEENSLVGSRKRKRSDQDRPSSGPEQTESDGSTDEQAMQRAIEEGPLLYYRPRDELLYILRNDPNVRVIYFHGWDGLGTKAVLRSIAQKVHHDLEAVPSEQIWFDRIVYLDCSAWNGRRAMQRAIAEEIKVDSKTMAMLDKQDEEDDFNGVHQGSRDVIRGVATEIYETLKDSKFLILLLNGSDEEIDVLTMGIPPFSEFSDHAMIWAFSRGSSLTLNSSASMYERAGKFRYTHQFYSCNYWEFELDEVLDQVAAAIAAGHSSMRSIDTPNTMVKKCCLYELWLRYSFHRTTKFDWVAHASNYWICDGIITGDTAKEISTALRREIIPWECDDAVLDRLFPEIRPPFIRAIKEGWGYKEGPYSSISVTSRNIEADGMQSIPAVTSSFFLAFDTQNEPTTLPASLFREARNLGVLILCHCTFSFASPPFFVSQCLRFLGLDHCSDDTTGSHRSEDWATICSLYVLDLRYTVWNEILSQEKMDLMINLRELHVEGARWWPDNTHLQGRLLNLEKLRITKSQGETSLADISTSFMDKTKLEMLDLSGSLWVKVLPTSLSKACSLQVLVLDGCEELETVVIPDGLPSSLRSFSFDSYGPVSKHWMPCPDELLPPNNLRPSSPDDGRQQQAAKTTKISLEGCTLLENLFVRGLPNLVELDLSGTAIKMLSFETMVVLVPGLKRLFLLGCEHLRWIAWDEDHLNLELLCIDTRAGIRGRPLQPSLVGGHGQKEPCFLLHAVLVDARLVESLNFPLLHHKKRNRSKEGIQFSIHFTSSSMNSGGGASAQQSEGTYEEKQMEEPSPNEHMRIRRHHQVPVLEAIPYPDVPDMSGDARMQDFPQPPFPPASSSAVDRRYIEVTQGSRNVEGELAVKGTLGRDIMRSCEFLHVHDSSIAASFPGYLKSVRWCRVERCPNMEAVFSADSVGFYKLETFWASDLLRARCIWSQIYIPGLEDCRSFSQLRHLHLRCCPRLEFMLDADGIYSFPSLETLHVIHCGELRHVFVLEATYRGREYIADHGVTFPKLTTIRLHDLPLLQQICVVKMLTPKLRTVKISGCWGMRRLSTVVATGGAGGGQASCGKPTVEIEKEVWEALEWDGADAGHHHSLFQTRHSRYYKKKTVRTTLLR